MVTARPYQLSLTIARLRRGVTVCCVLVSLCLLVQCAAWAIAYFTQVRFDIDRAGAFVEGRANDVAAQASAAGADATASEASRGASSNSRQPRRGSLTDRGAAEAPTHVPASAVVAAAGAAQAEPRGATAEPAGAIPNAAGAGRAAEPDAMAAALLPRSDIDHLLTGLLSVTSTVGVVAIVILVPLMALGLMIAVVGEVPGCERATTALLWASLFVAMSIPLARSLGVGHHEGLLLDAAALFGPLDATMGEDGFAHPGAFTMVRHLLLPCAAILGLALITLLYRAGLEAGLLPREMLTVDPVMDREVARVAASGPRLGGRTAAALGTTVSQQAPIPQVTEAPTSAPSTVRTSAGDAPRRII